MLTVSQVRVRKCVRCGAKPGYATWHVCSDNGKDRVLCANCDIELNELVMNWSGLPKTKPILTNYRHRVRRTERDREKKNNNK